MQVLDVYIEHSALPLDRPFSYLYFGTKKVGRGYRVIVPFHRQKSLIGFVSQVYDTNLTKEQFEQEKGYSCKEIIDVLDEECLINEELFTLAKRISSYYFCPFIRVLQTMLPPSIKPKSSALKAPKISYESYVVGIDDNEEGLSVKQKEWLRLVMKEKRILKKDFRAKTILDKLCALGRVTIVKEEKSRLQLPESQEVKPHILTPDQKNVVETFLSSSAQTYLLEGVTGSGKTEVYAYLSEQYLARGKSVLFLVPEIALTPMMIAYFSQRFQQKIAIFHSELTPGQRYDEYRRIAQGEAQIVIGTRSAIFAPLQNIGLIILDEEHVESYKQDHAPYYHAREIAKWRAEAHRAKVLLGSATPSLESRARAMKGVYQYLSLPHRIHQHELPETQIVNLLSPKNVDRESVLFSLALRKAMEETLARDEQVVLLLNRRGYAPYVSCRECGHVFRCPQCEITLTYHHDEKMLKCHHCDYVEEMPTHCPNCGSIYLSKQGFGTERIEAETKRLFPHARVLRLDSDVARVRTNSEKTLDKFRRHEADILIGTQMIAKGHDFPNVTLVGIVLADIGLNMPSFRSSERTFQLITQGVGRSGRGKKKGKAIIQTYMPDHYAIVHAAHQDYRSFYLTEMKVRKMQQYPPFYYLTSLRIYAEQEEYIDRVAIEMKEKLEEILSDQGIVIGPSTPFIKKQGEYFIRQIFIKYKDDSRMREAVDYVNRLFQGRAGFRLQINVDPYDF